MRLDRMFIYQLEVSFLISLSRFFTLAALMGVCLAALQAQAEPVRPLWEAPHGPSSSVQAQAWQSQLERDLRMQSAQRCPAVALPALDARRAVYAFVISPLADAFSQVVYVNDHLVQDVWLSGTDAAGCVFVMHAGRHVPVSERGIPSPYANISLPNDLGSQPLTLLVQDSKGKVPVVGLMEATAFTQESNKIFAGITAVSSTLRTILLISILFFVRSKVPGVRANVVFSACLWLWLVQTYGIGEFYVPGWPSADYFAWMQSIAGGALMVSLGWCVSHFVDLTPARRRQYLAHVWVLSALFGLSIVFQEIYEAVLVCVMLSILLTLVLVISAMATGQRVKVLYGLGVISLLISGLVQLISEIFLEQQGGLRTDFSLPIGAALLTAFWFIATYFLVREHREQELAHVLAQARTDKLTGLWNRDYLSEQINQRLSQHPEQAGPAHEVAVVILDIDNFKQINDSLGLALGSALLQGVAGRIQQTVRQQVGERALVGYMGGDEFMVMLEPGCSPAAVRTLTQLLASQVALPVALMGNEVRTTVSVGYVIGDGSGGGGHREAQDLIRDAYIANHEAQTRGRGAVVMFEPHMQTHTQARFNLERDLALAVEQQAFELHYQPIVTLADGVLAGFEALVRWQHPQRGWVSPAEFIPLAEANGLIEPLGRQVMARAVQTVAHWKDAGLWRAGWYVSVNVSGRQLQGHTLFEDLMRLLKRHGLQPQDVRLEITETSLIANMHDATTELPRLNREGVVLCMDDFGTGYSSLSHLNQLPFQVLKIDKSFMDDLTSNNKRQALVRTVLALARDMKLKVVAEGIERAEQHRWLADLACDFGQGYFFSKPMSERDAHRWLAKSRLAPAGLQAVLP